MAGWRIRRSFKLAPGVKVNVTGRGLGVSIGPRGAKIGISSTKGAYLHQSIPGTGIYKRTYLTKGSKSTKESAGAATETTIWGVVSAFFSRLFQASGGGFQSRDGVSERVTSSFLVTQLDLFRGTADNNGDIFLSDEAPGWLKTLHADAIRAAAAGDDYLGKDREWHGYGPRTEFTTGVCIANTPVKELISKWGSALRRYKLLSMRDVEKALEKEVYFISGHDPKYVSSPTQLTGVLFFDERVVHSVETLDLTPNGSYSFQVWMRFNLDDIGADLSAPFTYAVIRDRDEVRYKFHGGMR